MRPLTRRAWKRRFAEALYALTPHHDEAQCASLAQACADDYADMRVWSWPHPVGEASYEASVIEYEASVIEMEPPRMKIAAAMLPEHMRAPFLIDAAVRKMPRSSDGAEIDSLPRTGVIIKGERTVIVPAAA